MFTTGGLSKIWETLSPPSKYGPPTVPRFRLNTYGRRAFSAADPMAWNSLPDFIYGIQRAAQTVLGVLVRALLVHPAH